MPSCCSRVIARVLALIPLTALTLPAPAAAITAILLQSGSFSHHVEYFNSMEEENVTNCISNEDAWSWMHDNIPLFECPDNAVEEIYYYRWWSFRKHLKCTPSGHVFTEFLTPVSHAGEHNTVACAVGHHIDEGRWLRDKQFIDEYILYWFRGVDGKPQPHFHKFSSWVAAAVYGRYLVNLDQHFVEDLLPDLIADYNTWKEERLLPSGLFWQFDVRDGMEESISGSRRMQQARPTINSYMVANAQAISEVARLAGDLETAERFAQTTSNLRQRTVKALWNPESQFFEVLHPKDGFLDVREEIGFIPWMFHLPEPDRGYEVAWSQFGDPEGFRAPFGITTAERRHPEFRTHGVGTCEWDGAVWPFATSQTMVALANVLRDYPRPHVTKDDYFDAFITYVVSQHSNGKPYIGEYLDEVTGDWINGNGGRSRYYNHSTFADLLITGVVGLRPRPDDIVEVYPLLPPGTWNWFCLDRVPYHGHILTIFWDVDGSRYGHGRGLRVLVDGQEIARGVKLEQITGRLP